LKTKLCLRGKNMMYDLCREHHIPHRNTGKWIVAQTSQQWDELVKVHNFAREIGVPTHFLSVAEAKKEEPFVNAEAGVLVSPTTGIVDSHALMQFLLGGFEEREGDVALCSTVVGIERVGDEWEVRTKDRRTSEETVFTAEILINSAGHGACDINNMVLPKTRHRKAYFAKGNYFSYAPSSPSAKHLIYPAPEPGLGGLGTHLTLDITGRIRFGPDVEWVDSPDNLAVSSARLPDALREIKKFFPGIKEESIVPDYAGIRPKLGKDSAVATADGGKGFQDFCIQKEEGVDGFVNLLGIESPGLTSCLAIAEMVDGLLYRSQGGSGAGPDAGVA
jgi:2-hydroxyglutarate dehydrogenase